MLITVKYLNFPSTRQRRIVARSSTGSCACSETYISNNETVKFHNQTFRIHPLTFACRNTQKSELHFILLETNWSSSTSITSLKNGDGWVRAEIEDPVVTGVAAVINEMQRQNVSFTTLNRNNFEEVTENIKLAATLQPRTNLCPVNFTKILFFVAVKLNDDHLNSQPNQQTTTMFTSPF